MFALVLTGAPGAGKTSVAEALSDLLVGDDVRHALIETEALTSTHPPLSEEQWLMPVHAVCELYRRFAYPLLVVVATVESAAELEGLLGAVGADEHAAVALRADPATLRRRIAEREPAGWSGLGALVAATERIDAAVGALDVALVLRTEDQAAPAVAQRIRDAVPGPLGAVEPDIAQVVRTGTAAALEQRLREDPGLVGRRWGPRSWLHVVTDWPGRVPEAAAKIRALVAAGADVDAPFGGPQHDERPLHWAASSDDVEALDALLDAGADIDAGGGIIGDGTAMADAVAFGQWQAARRLLERGARTTLWQAAALGLTDRVRAELAASPPTRPDLDNALWCAAHGGRRETAELLLDHGADPTWIGHDELTAAQAAQRSGADELAAWLRSRSAAD